MGPSTMCRHAEKASSLHFLRYLRGFDQHDRQITVDEKPKRAALSVVNVRSRFVAPLFRDHLLISGLLCHSAKVHEREYIIPQSDINASIPRSHTARDITISAGSIDPPIKDPAGN